MEFREQTRHVFGGMGARRIESGLGVFDAMQHWTWIGRVGRHSCGRDDADGPRSDGPEEGDDGQTAMTERQADPARTGDKRRKTMRSYALAFGRRISCRRLLVR